MSLSLYGSPEYLAAQGTPSCLEDLDTHKLIAIEKDRLREDNPLNWHLSARSSSGEDRVPFLTVDSYSALQVAAEQVGGLVCLNPASLNQKGTTLSKLLSETPLPCMAFYLVYLSSTLKFSTHKAFYHFLKEKMQL